MAECLEQEGTSQDLLAIMAPPSLEDHERGKSSCSGQVICQ